MKTKLIGICLVLCFTGIAYSQSSPYETGFTAGTKEDLEIRLAWAKKDPCFDPGFSKSSREYGELIKYRTIQAGPNGKMPVCEKKK